MDKKKIAEEWLDKGRTDIEEADFLLKNHRSKEIISFHIQQAAEKYLKGFLISNGWELEKVHDLRKLVEEAAKFDKSFNKFIKPMRKITNFYFESRYPVGYDVKYTTEELSKAIRQTKNLIKIIEKNSKLKH